MYSFLSRNKYESLSVLVLRSHSNIGSRLIVSFVLQDRISCADNKHLPTNIGSVQNKAGNAGLAADAFGPEQHTVIGKNEDG